MNIQVLAVAACWHLSKREENWQEVSCCCDLETSAGVAALNHVPIFTHRTQKTLILHERSEVYCGWHHLWQFSFAEKQMIRHYRPLFGSPHILGRTSKLVKLVRSECRKAKLQSSHLINRYCTNVMRICLRISHRWLRHFGLCRFSSHYAVFHIVIEPSTFPNTLYRAAFR